MCYAQSILFHHCNIHTFTYYTKYIVDQGCAAVFFLLLLHDVIFQENNKSCGSLTTKPFITPAEARLPARSGSGQMLKLKHRAQPRCVTWNGKKLSNRSTPASTDASTSSGRPTPCSNLRSHVKKVSGCKSCRTCITF